MSKTKRTLLHLVIVVILIALGALGMNRLSANKPQLKKRQISAPVPMVRTTLVKTCRQAVIVRGDGTVRPLRQINLVPQVGGKVVYAAPSLVDGGEFKRDDLLLRIDPVDYRLAVTLAQAKVKDGESILKLAQENSAAALEEWRLHYAGGSRATMKPPPLVAKEPQLAAAKARLEADRANFKKALLSLGRTELRAPFDGRVSQENVDTGQYVSPGMSVATLYSTDVAEIMVPLEEEDLFWINVPGFTPGPGPGSQTTVRAQIAGAERSWSGEVVRSEGRLDERTRMINVVIRVKKPYMKRPPLAVGLFVAVDIEGHTLSNCALIPRSALRQGHVAWVVDNENRLRFRKVDVARVQGEKVLIRSGLKNGESLVISPLKVITDGMKVRVAHVNEGNRS